jgi:hypothetical protein
MPRVGRSPEALLAWAGQFNFYRLNLPTTGPFKLLALARIQPTASQEIISIYLEGDGAPWLSNFTPPPDPTPIRPLALGLASAQPSGTAIYLARPCQYLSGPNCAVAYWSKRRFSEEIMATYDDFLDRLKEKFPASRWRLIGYSGGGIIAMALQARRHDIAQVITVASPVDLAAWTQFHGLSQVEQAAFLPMNKVQANNLRHLAGSKDTVVPIAVAKAGAARYGGQLLEFPDFDHGCCWLGAWANHWKTIIGEE